MSVRTFAVDLSRYKLARINPSLLFLNTCNNRVTGIQTHLTQYSTLVTALPCIFGFKVSML